MVDFSSIPALATSLGALMPSGSAILENVLVGAAGNVVLKGLQAGGASALDPMGIFPHPSNTVNANSPNVSMGPTITASAYAALPPATQAQLIGAGVHIVAG